MGIVFLRIDLAKNVFALHGMALDARGGYWVAVLTIAAKNARLAPAHASFIRAGCS